MPNRIKHALLSLLAISLGLVIGYRYCSHRSIVDPYNPARVSAVAPNERRSEPTRTAERTASAKADDAGLEQLNRTEAIPRASSRRDKSTGLYALRRSGIEIAQNDARTRRSAEKTITARRARLHRWGSQNELADRTALRLRLQFGDGLGVDPGQMNNLIRNYEQSLTVDPDNVDVLVKEAHALNSRGAYQLRRQQFVQSFAAPNPKLDFDKASDLISRALQLTDHQLESSNPTSDEIAKYKDIRLSALNARAVTKRLLVTNYHALQADADQAYRDYLVAETDQTKKWRARRELAEMYFQTNGLDQAKIQYETILANKPDDIESLQRLSLVYFKTAAVKKRERDQAGSTADYAIANRYLSRALRLSREQFSLPSRSIRAAGRR